MRLWLWGGLAAVVLAGSALAEGAPQGDAAAGRKVAGMCRTCHGLDGLARIPLAPHIGGEPAAYLAGQLRAFRDGTRHNEMMTIVARSLSDAQIADVAAWYAAHQVRAVVPESGAHSELAALQACVACHGADGIAVLEDVPNLAGEPVPYIETQLKAYRAGRRTHEIMSAIAALLSDAEIRAAADWYSGIEIQIAPGD